MKRILAVAGILTAVLGLVCCGRQGPQKQQGKKQQRMIGILEDQNENVIVVKSPEGREYLFWMNGEINCPAENGDRVSVTYSGESPENGKVMNLISVEVL